MSASWQQQSFASSGWAKPIDPGDTAAFLALSIPELVSCITARKITSERVVRAYLDRIELRDNSLRAWAYVNGEGATIEARRRGPKSPAPLTGIPIGIKDIIDTVDMPTEYGSRAYAGHRPVADAACVALARQAGAIILGKTITAEFALAAPGATRNPVNELHTPGGSSSGSAAAVAAGMIPAALGSQTGGSLIRPAAYCGVVGYKPTFGLICRAGVKTLAESLDTLGVIARSVEDAAFVAGILAQRNFLSRATANTLCVGLYGVGDWSSYSQATQAALRHTAAGFEAAGAELVELPQFAEHEALLDAYQTIVLWECAASLAFERSNLMRALQPLTREILSLPVPLAEDYEAALALVRGARARLAERFGRCDILLAPATPDEAPLGIASSGDPTLCVIWSVLGVPCLTVPATRGPSGLPVGIQLIGRIGDDARLIMAGRLLEKTVAVARFQAEGTRGSHRDLSQMHSVR